ncbi:hypothetical protein GCK72_007136 [Caenorhabditis remanei]|uniref:NR LBD domain-containing protein n=1 Tax=Caenorhabditis remanei TaxID=31234 RepID=A0A6A5HKU5_CAERE|nr:hypothetical protein GCK72_007136 [Caenorhabditis remanei]KAF1767177.1 hypothetical protein GCK72_007136 [Caenorhabditis remanei]
MVIAPEARQSPESDSEVFGKHLATNPQELLSFYVEHSKISLVKLRGSLVALMQNPLNQLPAIKLQTDEVAFDLCSLSPGADLLQNPDLEILFRHCSFVSLWINLAYISTECPLSESDNEAVLTKFIRRLLTGITPEFRRLKLDPVEFAALKAICVWKVSPLNNNSTAKVIAGEQYLGVAKALNEYHQAIYQEMSMMYAALNINDSYSGDFF